MEITESITQYIDRLLLSTAAFLIAVLAALYFSYTSQFYVEAAFFLVVAVITGILLIGQARELETAY